MLITLGIIGIVAALTMPSLIAKHQKKVVVTRLEKFYSTMSQAVNLSSMDNGAAIFLEQGPQANPDKTLEFFNKALAPYLKTVSVKKTNDGIQAALPDGSGFGIYQLHVYFCVKNKVCEDKLKETDNSSRTIFADKLDGKDIFGFYLYNNPRKFMAYGADIAGETREDILNHTPKLGYDINYGCAQPLHKFCALLIQHDGWEIRDDYPVKF